MFKSGDWLIRKWNEDYHSSIDFARIDVDCKTEFLTSFFFRFGDGDSEDYSEDLSSQASGRPIDYKDDASRMEFDWRKATEDEIKKYLTLSTLANKI